ncbi:MAG: 2-hydroxychromene-2-carboxylate isomerase [Vicinamibacteria bacterium]
MEKTIDFYYDFSSPNAYFASLQLRPLARRYGARVVALPIYLGGVFKALGTGPSLSNPARNLYRQLDLDRWGKKYEIPFRFPSRFPVNSVYALRGSIAMEEQGKLGAYIDRVFRAYWVEDQAIDDRPLLAELVRSIGGNAEKFLARIEADEIKDRLRALTDKAMERGAFGSPIFFVGDEMFWGKDRLDFVEDALR